MRARCGLAMGQHVVSPGMHFLGPIPHPALFSTCPETPAGRSQKPRCVRSLVILSPAPLGPVQDEPLLKVSGDGPVLSHLPALLCSGISLLRAGAWVVEWFLPPLHLIV